MNIHCVGCGKARIVPHGSLYPPPTCEDCSSNPRLHRYLSQMQTNAHDKAVQERLDRIENWLGTPGSPYAGLRAGELRQLPDGSVAPAPHTDEFDALPLEEQDRLKKLWLGMDVHAGQVQILPPGMTYVAGYAPLSPEQVAAHRAVCKSTLLNDSPEELLRNRRVCEKTIAEARIEIEECDRLLAQWGLMEAKAHFHQPMPRSIDEQMDIPSLPRIPAIHTPEDYEASRHRIRKGDFPACACKPGAMHSPRCPAVRYIEMIDGEVFQTRDGVFVEPPDSDGAEALETAGRLLAADHFGKALAESVSGFGQALAETASSLGDIVNQVAKAIRPTCRRCGKSNLTMNVKTVRDSVLSCCDCGESWNPFRTPTAAEFVATEDVQAGEMATDKNARQIKAQETAGMLLSEMVAAAQPVLHPPTWACPRGHTDHVTEEAAEACAARHEIGDQVQPNGGGQVMTIELIFSDGRLRCRWTKPSGLVERADFEPDAVQRVDDAQIPF